MKEFIKILKSIDYSKNIYNVFADFVKLSALSIANSVFFNQAFEDEYLSIVKRYDDVEKFLQLFVMLTEKLETNPFQDFLGELYMNLGTYNKNTGQFFTPYHISKVMALCSFNEKILNKNGFLTMNESACGSGANIIALAEIIKDKGYNPSTSFLFKAQDLDEICVYMCYVQTSLIGLSGSVVLGNTLSDENKKTLVTPMFFNKIWDLKHCEQQVKKIIEAFKILSKPQNQYVYKQLNLDFKF